LPVCHCRHPSKTLIKASKPHAGISMCTWDMCWVVLEGAEVVGAADVLTCMQHEGCSSTDYQGHLIRDCLP
jgi:hypothetical protein